MFDELGVKDVIQCTSLIADYVEHDRAKEALNYLWENAIGQCGLLLCNLENVSVFRVWGRREKGFGGEKSKSF